MNLPKLPLIDGCLFVDNSGWIESLSTCNRLHEYKSLRLRIAAGESAALNFGSAIHMALEFRYRHYRNKSVDDKYYNDVSGLLTSFFEAHPTPADDWRTLNLAMDITRRYNKKYDIEEFNLLLDKNENPMVELPFALELFTFYPKGWTTEQLEGVPVGVDGPFIKVIYTGRIDLPLALNGQIYVLDFKTTGNLGTSFFDGKRMSSQPKGYCWGFEGLTGQRVAGYIIRGIRSKEIPQYVLNGKNYTRGGKTTTPDQWWNESLQEEKYLLRPDDLVEWKENTISLIEEFFWHYQRDYMPMRTGNEHACVNYGRCQFYEICRLAREDRGLMLASGAFTNNVWSPLKQPTQSKQ